MKAYIYNKIKTIDLSNYTGLDVIIICTGNEILFYYIVNNNNNDTCYQIYICRAYMFVIYMMFRFSEHKF